MNTKVIIKKISDIRVRNNRKWMKLLEIAFKYAPEESRKIMSAITQNDMAVSKLSGKLAGVGNDRKRRN